MRRAEQAEGTYLLKAVGLRVNWIRRGLGLTQEQLAEHAGWSVRYLQEVEGGKENLTLRSLAALAALLNVNVSELFKPAEGVELPRPRGRPKKRV